MSTASPTAPRRVRALIVDDELLARQRVLSLLAGERDVEVVGEAESGSDAVESISRLRPDLLFLDVQMPGLDGFGVLRCTARAHVPVVVFVTAHDEHAIRAFDVQAVDYLLKPVSSLRFHEAVRRAVVRVRSGTSSEQSSAIDRLLAHVAEPSASAVSQGPRIPVRRDGRIGFVAVADIDWVSADGDHLQIHAAGDVHTLRETMSDFESQLPPQRFARVHRSTIVNVDRVQDVEPIRKGGYLLTLRDGTRLRCGKTHAHAVRALIRGTGSARV